ncbi:hypothetical protein [Streptomyces clavifer]|uniref:hypothetical protein n=1 Tax=Streptomyces clavifer TaxID=68188 RepID=UPI003655D4F7
MQDVEEGFDSEFVWEYANMLRCRGWLAEAWPVFTDRIPAERQAGLDALDARMGSAVHSTLQLGWVLLLIAGG